MKDWDPVVLVSISILLIISFSVIISANIVPIIFTKWDSLLPYKQLIFQVISVVIGFFIAFYISKIDYKSLNNKEKIYILFGLNLVLLLIVLVLKFAEHRDVNRWLFGTSIQVSEFSKIVNIIFLSYYISQKDVGDLNKNILFVSGLMIIESFLLFLEPDRGSAIYVLIFTAAMLWVGGLKSKLLVPIFVIFAIIGFSFLFLKIGGNYVHGRIVAWLNPFSEANTKGYQIIQSLYAFAHGKIFGVGLGEGIQKEGYLPEVDTDYALALIGEEWGFIGISFVILTYLALVLRLMYISTKIKDIFGKLIVFGVGLHIAMQSILNMAMATNLIPSKGIALVFISYGSSNIIANFLGIGLAMSVYIKEKRRWLR